MTLNDPKSLGGKQFFRVRQRIPRDLAAAEQAGELLQTGAFIQRLHVRFGHGSVGFFADVEVVMTTARHLREVRYAHHLRGFAQLAQQFANHGGGRAADAHVHLIKDQRRGFHFTRGDHLDRQRDTGQLTAGGDFSDGLQRLTGVCRHAKLNAVRAFFREVTLVKTHINGEDAVRHGE